MKRLEKTGNLAIRIEHRIGRLDIPGRLRSDVFVDRLPYFLRNDDEVRKGQHYELGYLRRLSRAN